MKPNQRIEVLRAAYAERRNPIDTATALSIRALGAVLLVVLAVVILAVSIVRA